MKTLDARVRGYRWQLDERRREIADLERLAAQLRDQQGKIDRDQKATEAAGSAARHIAAMAERRARIEQSLAEVDVQLRQAREGLTEVYYGMRRHEIVASARAEQNRRRGRG